MEKILDMKKAFLSSVCFSLLPTYVAWDNIFSIFSCCVIALEHCFGTMALVTIIMGTIYL